MISGYNSNRSRFISDKAVISALVMDGDKLPAKIKPELAKDLALPEDVNIDALTRVVTKGVGATQCRPYIVHFNNGEKRFLKLSPLHKNSVAEQRHADREIKDVLGEGTEYPFVCLNASKRANENGTQNELLFFPFVPGDNLFITLVHRNNNDAKLASLQFAAIGECLAGMHLRCMQAKGAYEHFLHDGHLQGVLVHDDWQSTNIMITPNNEAVIVDTEGTTFSSKHAAYRNLVESWELTGKDASLMTALLDAYVNAFPPELHDKISGHVYNTLKEHGIDLRVAKPSI